MRHAAGRAIRRAPPHRHHGAARVQRRRVALLRREHQRAAAVRAQARHHGTAPLRARLFTSPLLRFAVTPFSAPGSVGSIPTSILGVMYI